MEREYREGQEQSSAEDLGNRRPATLSEAYSRMKDSVHAAQSDAERARVQSEQSRRDIEELRSELQSQGRKTKGTGWIAAFLLAVLLGACAYGYLTLERQGLTLAQLPGLQKSLDTIGQRINGTEDQLRSWVGNWDGLTARLDRVEKGVSASLRSAKDFATVQAAKVQHELQGEMDNRTRSINAKLDRLETSQQQDRVQLAALQQQVTDVSSETHQQLATAQQESAREFGRMRNEINQNRDDLNTVTRNLDQQRVDFEVSKKQSRELVPGLAFTVLATDVGHQQVNGFLHLIPGGHILWVHDQGIEQPMLFHNHYDKRAYEVVFTRVAADSAAGYVLMPRWPAADTPVASMASAPLPIAASVQ